MAHTDVDTIVIGSGAGGLTAALALARAGQSVTVFEQHYLPGGWCHSFTLEGYQFSPGVHYIGELGEGGRMRAMWEGLGLGDDLTFLELNPDGFDHVRLGDGYAFDIPAGYETYKARLQARFPHEAAGIEKYLHIARSIAQELDELPRVKGLKDLVDLPRQMPNVARYGVRSLNSLLDACDLHDPHLRTTLSIQAGDHGMAPKKAMAAMHCSVQNHYFDGGWYPKGGAKAIPRAYIKQLKKYGAEVKVRTPVAKILMEKGRAIGVRLGDGTEVRAKHVITNADPGVTYGRLIDEEDLPLRIKLRMKATTYSTSCLSLFMAADGDLRDLGLDSGNLWYTRTPDVDATYSSSGFAGSAKGPIPGLFLTVTTMKDPTKRHDGKHTMECFTFVDWKTFEKWRSSRYGDRPEGYEKFKAELTDHMLATVDEVVPGLRERICFTSLGTPMTNVHYVDATDGNVYGTEKNRWQVGPLAWPVNTPIDGLWACGQSTLSHGVMGVVMSGLACAGSILKTSGRKLLDDRGTHIKLLDAESLAQTPQTKVA